MSKKQQAKFKRQFSYLKKQFTREGIDVSELKYEDLEQKTFSSLGSMRAKMIEKSGILEDLSVTSRKGQVFVKHENMKNAVMLNFKKLSDKSYIESLYVENGVDVRKLKKVEDKFYSYYVVYYEEGVRVDDYNNSPFYELYHGIWDDINAGYYLSYLVFMAKRYGGKYADFLTYDLKITDYKFYTFDSINYSMKEIKDEE